MFIWVSVVDACRLFGCVLLCVVILPSHAISTSDHLAINAPQIADVKTLVHVHAIWRHGDRTPSSFIPSDKNNNAESWGNMTGELTYEGIQQQYRLGKWIRQRYNKFLSEHFSPSEIYVRSSDFNRTLMSAQANLAAMFKPPANQILANDLRWLPIPVHTVAKESDPQLYESIECPAANKKVTQMYAQNKEIVALEKKNAALLNYIAKNAHWPNGTLSLSEMWFIFDPLNVVFHHNDTHKMPKWVNSTIWNEIVRLYDQTCQFYFSTDKVKRLRAGMLLKDIIGHLKRKSQNPVTEREKFYAYSAHDMTVAAILSAMGIRPAVFPLYASLVLIELHKHSGGPFTVKLFYKNVTDSPALFEFPIEGCAKPCTLDSFISRSQKYIPDDWKRECGLKESNPESILTNAYNKGVILSLSISTAILSMIMAVSLLKKYLERQRRYEGRVRLSTSEQSCDTLT